MRALTFRHTEFEVVDQQGQPWLQASQIAEALGYRSRDAVSRIYRRNADEFTSTMVGTVKLTVPGNPIPIPVRVFSLRGAHLIAMFARTEPAKAFRRWVLDILDAEAQRSHEAPLLNEYDAQNLRALCHNMIEARRIFLEYRLYDALRLLGSPAGIAMQDRLKDGASIARSFARRIPQATSARLH